MPGFWLRPAVRGLQVVACATVVCAVGAAGQTLTTGALRGSVRGADGAVLGGVSVTVIDATTQVSRTLMTAQTGTFALTQLTPGEYDVVAERLGYRPVRLVGIPVRPLSQTPVTLVLAPAAPPVGNADVEQFQGAALASGGTREWFGPGQLRGYPSLYRDLSQVGRLSSLSDRTLAMQGLPAWMTGVVADGVPITPLRHPGLAGTPQRTAEFPLGSMEVAEVVTNPTDVEWAGDAGGLLQGYTLRGTRDLQVRGFGLWSGGPLGTSDPAAGQLGSPKDVEGALLIGGPLAGDSAHVLVGVQGQQIERPLGAAWTGANAATVLALARDSLGVTLDPYTRSRTVKNGSLSAFSRVDWQVTPLHAVELRASFATIPASNASADLAAGLGPLTTYKGSDVSVGGTLRSELSPTTTSELRFGVDRETRDFTAASDAAGTSTQIPFVGLPSEGISFGTDPSLPGSFTATTIHVGDAIQVRKGLQELKFGLELQAPRYEQTYQFASAGQAYFGSVTGLGHRDAVFSRATGAVPTASFSVPRVALFFQDRWSALPGLQVTAGLRAEEERLPLKNVLLNQVWDSLTGISNASFAKAKFRLSPRASFTWDLGQQGRWIVQGAGGLFYDRVDPAILAQALTDDGHTRILRGAGVLSGWPDLSGSGTITTLEPSLTVLGPKFTGPRTARGSGSLTLMLGEGTSLRVSGIVRHTDYLPRRTDLNLVPGAVGEDQFGRPLYGRFLSKAGLLAAVPGSNRRFEQFDAVTGIAADGSSDYRAVTVALEGEASPRLSFLGSYTYSTTTDNWVGGGLVAGGAGYLPGLGGTLASWAQGTSDFDVPNRLVLGGRVLGPAGVRLTALYRYSSGRPFTPGFAPGIDANGDGVAGNDPAYVSTGVSGASDVINAWSCLRSQTGIFAARNSCRASATQSLDARLAVHLFSVAGSSAELRVDAIDLVHGGDALPDPALYLVDPAGTVTTDASGHATVPLVANPHFGKSLGLTAPGATFLVGFSLNW